MKTVIDMAREAGGRAQQNKNCDVEYLMSADALNRLVELVRADERKNFCAALRQMHDAYSLASDPSGLKVRGNK
jgi:hypothetical protein